MNIEALGELSSAPTFRPRLKLFLALLLLCIMAVLMMGCGFCLYKSPSRSVMCVGALNQ